MTKIKKLANSRSFLFALICILIAVLIPDTPEKEYFAEAPLMQKQTRVKPDKITNVGFAAFAIRSKNWECSKFIKAIKPLKTLHIAIVWDSFGTDNDCLIKLMKDPRLMSLEIIMFNEVCVRNGDCYPTDFLYGYTRTSYENALNSRDKKLMRRIRKSYNEVKTFLDTYALPNTQCYINPGLESNISDRALNILVRLTRKKLPTCMIVANPLSKYAGSGYKTEADFREYHGTELPSPWQPCFTDLDGLDIEFPERASLQNSGWMQHIHAGTQLQSYLATATKACELSFIWTREANCFNVDQKITKYKPDPSQRECKSGDVYRLMAEQILIANQTNRW